MKKFITFLTLSFISAATFAGMSDMVGEKVDSAATTTKSSTDKTANPISGKANALGMGNVSKKVDQTAGTTKKKTDLGATKIKKVAGATDAKATAVKTSATESKEDLLKKANDALTTPTPVK